MSPLLSWIHARPLPAPFQREQAAARDPHRGAGGRGGHDRSRAGGAQTGFFWRELSCQLTHAKIVFRHIRIQNMLIISTERYISDSVYLLMYINFAAMARNIQGCVYQQGKIIIS